MTNVYNEIDPFAAEWLERLIEHGHLPPGRVERRSIADLSGVDVEATQAHFFAGIGGWPLALDLAGWPRDLPVWTGSCPCQPFSSAGKRKGFDDEKHLWPEFFRLIRDRAPAFVFGEQVASRDGLAWLDLVSRDFASAGYAFRAVDLAGGGFGAPHKRSRLFFVAVADADSRRSRGLDALLREQGEGHRSEDPRSGALDGAVGQALVDTDGEQSRACTEAGVRQRSLLGGSLDGAVGDSCGLGGGQDGGGLPRAEAEGQGEGIDARDLAHRSFAASLARAAWGDGEWIPCADGRARLTRSGTLPLAHGVPHRVGRLRGYGNAIIPQVAAIFIRSVLECFAP